MPSSLVTKAINAATASIEAVKDDLETLMNEQQQVLDDVGNDGNDLTDAQTATVEALEALLQSLEDATNDLDGAIGALHRAT